MRRRSALGFLFLFVFCCLGLFSAAFAQSQTPAGTAITNQATATYTNAAGEELAAESNEVTTIVQAIYRFEITPDGTDTVTGAGQTLTGAAGDTVVFTYQIENQGNTDTNTINLSTLDSATDTGNFGTKTIYLDNPTSGIQGVLDPADTVVTSVVLAPGEVATLFVEAAIPATAADGDSIRLNLTGTSAVDSETDTNNWAELEAFTNADISITKTATPNVSPGGQISYTVSGSNAGGTNPFAVDNVVFINNSPAGPRDGIVVTDVLPTGLMYVANSLAFSGSNTASTSVPIYSVDGGATWGTAQPASGINAVGIFIPGSVGTRISTTGGAAFAYGFTFSATASATAPAGSTYENTATLSYDSNGDGDSGDTGENPTSDPATTTVDQAGTFAVGPYTFPNAGATGTYMVAGEGYTITRSGDTQTVASVPNEREVSFRHSLENATNYDDSYSLTSTLAGLPAGSVTFYAVNPDGSRGAEITSTLAVAAGATAEFYMVVTLPADYTTATPLNFEVTATSEETGLADTTINEISAVTEAQAVDIGNYDGDGTPNDTPQDFPAAPGDTVSIELIVANPGADADTFDLTSVIVPAGYTVTIYFDANCDGIVPAGDTAVTDTGEIDAGGFACFIAQVVVPAGAAPADYDLTVTATSQSDPDISDSITNTITVGLLQDFTFDEDESGATNATVPIVYTHTLTNNSNDAATVDITLTEPGTAGWTYAYSLDGVTYTTVLPEDIALAANGSPQTLYVRVTPGPGAADSYVDSFTLTATPTYTGGIVGEPDTVTDTTTISAAVFGLLELDKTVSVNGAPATNQDTEAEPGDTLTYIIVATNTGAGNLTNVKVLDTVPANTTFVSVSAVASGGLAGDPIRYSTNGTTWTATAPATVATGGSIYVGVSTNGDGTISIADIFPPDGVLTITLTVTID